MTDQGFTAPFIKLVLEELPAAAEERGDQYAAEYFYDRLVELGQLERLKNLYRCKDKQTKKKVWLRPNAEQEKYYAKMTRRDLILKPRQVGFTQFSINLGVDNCIFVPGTQEGMMAHKKEKAVAELFQRVRDTFEWFVEDWGKLIPLTFDKDNANQLIVMTAGSRIMKTSYSVSHDFRSSSLTRLHMSEASRVDIKRAQGSIDSVPELGQVIMETTANGREKVFYSAWKATKDAKRRKNIYVWEHHFFPWFEHYPEPGSHVTVPEHFALDDKEKHLKAMGASDQAIAWRRYKIAENFLDDPDKFDEEYPSDDETCFLGGRSFIPRKYLVMLDKWVVAPAKQGHLVPDGSWMRLMEDDRGYLSIWQTPKIGESYVIGADVSEGVGQDWSVAYVRQRSNGNYVARIRGQYFPEEFAEALLMLAKYFNSAWICFELNNHGHVLKDRLVNKHNYANLYRRRVLDETSSSWMMQVGFRTDRTSKERVASNFVARLREGKVHPYCEDLLTELTTFQRDDNGRLGAIDGAHDDCVMAAFLTEEMEEALGPYQTNEIYEEDVRCDPVTGFPLAV